MSKQLRDELDLFIKAALPVIQAREQQLGVQQAIQAHLNHRVRDRHTADCQAYHAMYYVYGCEEYVRIGGAPTANCIYHL